MRKIVLLIAALSVLLSCKTKLIVHDFKADNIPNYQNISTIDSSIVNFVQPYSADIEREMHKVVAESSVELIKKKPESLLTNYLSDLILHEGQMFASRYPGRPIPDAAFLNYGSIRINLPKGQITVGKIFEMMPFENEIVLLKLKGEDLWKMAEKIAENEGDCVAGMKLTIKDEKVETFEINNKPVNKGINYWLVTIDYVANGGDDMTMFQNRETMINTGIKLRDCFIEHMQNEYDAGKLISPKLDGRITYE